MTTLLPPSATPQEIALEAATARISDVPTPARELWSPDDCPVEFLPWLAWAFSLDNWNPDWTEAQKRAAVRSSLYVHKHKGTIGALEQALSSLGYAIDVSEWFKQSPPGDPYTFDVNVQISDSGITEALIAEIIDIVYRTKNLRSHFGKLRTIGAVKGPVHIGAAMHFANSATVFPYNPGTIAVATPFNVAAVFKFANTVSVYPQ